MHTVTQTSDRRSNPRFLCAGTAELFLTPDTPPLSAAVTNLSLLGCQLKLSDTLRWNKFKLLSAYEIAFSVNGEPFRVKAQLRSQSNNFLMGMLLVELSSRTKLRIEDLILELAQRSADIQEQHRELKRAS